MLRRYEFRCSGVPKPHMKPSLIYLKMRCAYIDLVIQDPDRGGSEDPPDEHCLQPSFTLAKIATVWLYDWEAFLCARMGCWPTRAWLYLFAAKTPAPKIVLSGSPYEFHHAAHNMQQYFCGPNCTNRLQMRKQWLKLCVRMSCQLRKNVAVCRCYRDRPKTNVRALVRMSVTLLRFRACSRYGKY